MAIAKELIEIWYGVTIRRSDIREVCHSKKNSKTFYVQVLTYDPEVKYKTTFKHKDDMLDTYSKLIYNMGRN